MSNILIIKHGSLGDIAQASGAIQDICENHKVWKCPYESIHWIETTEKEAVEAERASTKYMQVVFLQDKIGESFSGKINGLTDWGFYVELNDNKCEGLVQINSLEGDHYYFDQEQKKIIGHNTKETFTIGQEVQVTVKNTDLKKRQIDFLLDN